MGVFRRRCLIGAQHNGRIPARLFSYLVSSKQRRPPLRPGTARLPSACAVPTVSRVGGGRPSDSRLATALGATAQCPGAVAFWYDMSNAIACDGSLYVFGSPFYPMNLQSFSFPPPASLARSLARSHSYPFRPSRLPSLPAATVSCSSTIEKDTTLLRKS